MKKLFALVLSLVFALSFTSIAFAENNYVDAEVVFAWADDFCRISYYSDKCDEVIYYYPADILGEEAVNDCEYHMMWLRDERSYSLVAVMKDGTFVNEWKFTTEEWAANIEKLMERSISMDIEFTGCSPLQGNFVLTIDVETGRTTDRFSPAVFEGGTNEGFGLEETVNYLNGRLPAFGWPCFGRVNGDGETFRFDIFVPEHNNTYFVDAYIDEDGEVIASYASVQTALMCMENQAAKIK